MRVLIHYESVNYGQCADVLCIEDMSDECLMRKLRALDADHSVVVGIDAIPHYMRLEGDEGYARVVQ